MSNTSFCHVIGCDNLEGDFLEPYADISGTGVLVGFIGTAYLAFVLVTVSYFLAFDPSENPFNSRITVDEDAANAYWKPNPIDKRLIAWIRKPSLLISSTHERLRAAFDEAIILLCDIQIVTGIGILVSGFMLLKCGLDACHWQIVVYLAWFSTVTHLSGLNILRGRLNTTPWAKYVRVFLMLALLVLVVVGLLPTGFFNNANFSSQAICYFNQSYGYWRHDAMPNKTWRSPGPVTATAEWQAMAMSVILLICGFVSRCFKLFQPLSTAFRVQIRSPISRLAQRNLERLEEPSSSVSLCWRDRLKLSIVTRPALAIFLMVRLSCDLFGSTIFEVYWLFVILLWGTVKVLAARNTISSKSPEVALEEEQWTFGQILPVFLLLGPLFAIAGIFASKMTETASNPASRYGREAYIIGSNVTGRRTQLHSGTAESISFDSLEVTTQEGLDRLEPPPPPSTPAVPISNPSEMDLMHLKDYSNAQWLPICVAVPFLSIVAATIVLFAAVFNFGLSFEPNQTLYEVWIGQFNMIYILSISYPCACATTIRFGLGMNLSGGWRKFGFFWLCSILYTVYFLLAFPLLLSVPEWNEFAPYSGIILGLSLYLGHVLISLPRALAGRNLRFALLIPQGLLLYNR